jgi:DNA-binding MarR family transcriptional regulator
MKREETICYGIKTSWHAISRMYNSLGSQDDVSTSVGFVLLNIDPEQGTPATKIAPKMGLESRSLTRILKSLEEKKWIYREADKKDKRMVRIMLSPIGREKRDLTKIAVNSFNQNLQKIVPEEKLDIFFEVLNNVNTYLADIKV